MSHSGFFYALLTSFMFATYGIFIKFIYKYQDISPNIIFFISSFISCFVMLIILSIKNKNFSFLKIDKKELIEPCLFAGLIVLFLVNIFVLKSLEYVGVGLQKVITYSNPLFIIIINKFILNKKLSIKCIISMSLILTGLILIVGKIDFSSQNNIFYGILFALTSSIFVAIYSVLSENRNTKKINLLEYWFYAFFSASIYSFIYMIFSGGLEQINVLFTIEFKILFLLFCVAMINFLLPYLTFSKSIKMLGAEKTGIVLTTAPVFSIIFSILILNEKLTFFQALGSLLIISSSLISFIDLNKLKAIRSKITK